jgi:hypothetical protein
MQRIDTLLLVLIMISALIIFQEDRGGSPLRRWFWLIVGFGCFAQATWLQGYWWPSAAGYPWAALMRDGGIAGLAVLRAVNALHCLRLTKRRLEKVQRSARLNG